MKGSGVILESTQRRVALASLRMIGRIGAMRPFVWLRAFLPADLKSRVRESLVNVATGGSVAIEFGSVDDITDREAAPLPSAIISTSGHDLNGVNLIGYVRGGLGLAENVRSFARALSERGFPFTLIDANVLESDRNTHDAQSLQLDDKGTFAVDIFFVNPDRLSDALDAIPASPARYRIGYWFWELEKIPAEWFPALDMVDEIWVSSQFVREAFAKVTQKPITLIPMAVEVPAVKPSTAAKLGNADHAFTFLFSFDFHSFVARKNPAAVVDAFLAAFPIRRDDVRLIIKCTNGEIFRDQFYDLIGYASTDRRIHVQNGFVTRAQMIALMNSVDAYVSLHRSEGFGLGLAECMYLGKPVIGTAYSGNLQFMTSENSCLVDFTLVDVKPGEYMHTDGQKWAAANIADAARYMRRLVDDRECAVQLGCRSALDMRALHSHQRCSDAAVDRLRHIYTYLDAADTRVSELHKTH